MGRGGRLGFSIFVLAAAPAAAQEPAAPAGPAAYWRLDEPAGTAAANVMPGAPPGAHQGGVSISAAVPALSYNNNPGATPRSLLFDGATGTVNVANFGSFTETTVSVWIFRTGATAGRQSIVSYKEGNGVNMGFVFCLNENGVNHYPRLWVQVNGGWVFAEQAVSIPTGAWVHLAGVYNGADILLYRDGNPVPVATQAAAGTMTNTGSQTTGIGARASLDQNWFPGNIDDVRVYSRDLSPEEVAVLAAGVPAPVQNPAVGGIGQVSLSWTAPAGAVTYTYNVQRAPAGSTAFAPIATGVAGTTYTDLTATSGFSFDYVVTAVSAAESGISNIRSATSVFPPPRTKDHEEGLLDSNCACGSTAAGAPAGAALLALAALAAALRPRRSR